MHECRLEEINIALNYTNKDNIIYTNPHMIPYEITSIKNTGVRIKVVDSMNEMKKLVAHHFLPDILIRLKSNIYDANCAFDSKFGCDESDALNIKNWLRIFSTITELLVSIPKSKVIKK
jgi:diaminopimelate decarboxylase